MGKAAKTSRKGKKAWRANISTDDIEEYFEKETKDTLSGVKYLPSVPSRDLFFLDKATSEIPVKRKIEKNREKVLHCESVLQRNAFVRPVPSSVSNKNKKKKVSKAGNEVQHTTKEDGNIASSALDIWNDKGAAAVKAKKKCANSVIPAVEVEAPGCSFNPPFEAHQDSLAKAVADEMQKQYRKELGPQPVPLIVQGELISEEDKLFIETYCENGDETIDEDLSKAPDGGNEDEDLAMVNSALLAERLSKTKKLTRVELNRRARRKVHLRAEAEAKKMLNINKEIDSIPDIMKEISKEDEESNRRKVRRSVAKFEKLKSGPPRLGKHKFEPAPVQVLLSEEISGSLRKLKGCSTLTRDRMKSLEKRGIVVPRAKGSRRK